MRLLKLVPDNTNLDFLRWRNIAIAISTLLIIASIALIAVKGLNFGVDFVGGQVIRTTFAQPPSLDELREDVASLGLGDPSVSGIRQHPRNRRSACPCPTGGEEGANAAASKVRQALQQAISRRPHRRGRHRVRQGLRRAGLGRGAGASALGDRHRHLHLDPLRMAVRRRRAVLPVPRRHADAWASSRSPRWSSTSTSSRRC